MATIQFSGNESNPESFSVFDAENLTKTYNNTIDAINFILWYTGRTNQETIKKSLTYCGIESLEHIKPFPVNKLVSAIAMAHDFYKQTARGPYECFSLLSTEKILNAIYEYETEYSDRCKKVSLMCWAFQTEVILALDKLYSEIKQFKKKYKHLHKMHRTISQVDDFLQKTLNIIGAPENTWFNGSMTLSTAFVIRDKLSENQTAIFPIHLYRDIMRFNEVQESILQHKREHSHKKHYDAISHELDSTDNRNFELAAANHELANRVAALEAENKRLRALKSNSDAQNSRLSIQIRNMRQSVIGNLLFKMTQKRK